LEDLSVDVKVMLNRILKIYDARKWIEFGSGYGKEASCCESGNEPSDSIKYSELPVLALSASQKHSTPWELVS
jgi:hypothetical protein